MIFEPKKIMTKDCRRVILRNARVEDSQALVEYLRTIARESRYLTNEPEEVTITLEREEAFLAGKTEEERELMLIGEIIDADGNARHVGNCSLMSMGNKLRVRHRCGIAIALYKEFCGLGIGKQMMEAVLDVAKSCGYEQAELEVVTTNTPAIRLYKSVGFEIYGERKKDMKYKDGTYADMYLMSRAL